MRASEKTRRLTGLALMTAIIVVLQVVASFVKFGPFTITLALAPVSYTHLALGHCQVLRYHRTGHHVRQRAGGGRGPGGAAPAHPTQAVKPARPANAGRAFWFCPGTRHNLRLIPIGM